MKILKWLAFTIIGLVALILLVALFLPGSVKIVSEKEINLPVYKVYYSLASFTGRTAWDPWVTKDSTAKVTLTPMEGFVGTKYSWTSENSGSGNMVIDSVVKDRHIYLTLTFDGMNQKPLVWHDFSGSGGKTMVSWGFSQDAGYPLGRVFMAIMKSKIQADFDEGLSNLKKHLEEKGVQMSTLSKILPEKIPPFYALVAEGKGTLSEMSSMMSEMFVRVTASAQSQGIEIIGPPFNHYIYFDEASGVSIFEVGFPVNKAGKSGDGIKSMLVPGFSALEAIHTGPYTEFGISYSIFLKHIAGQKLEVTAGTWEFYLNDPMTEPDEMKWRTLIAFPLK